MPLSAQAPMVVEAALRRAEILKDRASGMTQAQLAVKHGISRRRVRALLEKEYARLGEIRADLAVEQTRVILDRLEELYASHVDEALEGDHKSTEVVLKILERQCRLLGLDAPVRVNSQLITTDMSLQEIRAQAEALGLVEAREALPAPESRQPVSVKVTVVKTEP